MSIKLPDSKQMDSMSAADMFTLLQSSLDGLTSAEAAERLSTFGPNALAEHKESKWTKLFRFFWGPIPWMIEIAIILSLIAKDWNDAIIITVLLLFNAGIGFWEDFKASNALDALKAGLALQAQVLRDGKWQQIPSADLVPGDVVNIRLGDVVPADCKLAKGDYLSVDQAALTGESLPVSKKVDDMAYSGSIAKQGEMTGLVGATGSNTFFGRTAKLVASAGAQSHFQQAVMRVGDFLIILALILCVILSGVLLHRDYVGAGGFTLPAILAMAKFILILAVASIPVAMPAVLSITMALGALELSKQKAIVSRLQTIEEMAGIDILCSDKTGTLTKNELTIDTPVIIGDTSVEEIELYGALASRAENNDVIDNTIISAVKDKEKLSEFSLVKFTPFDPVSKRTEAILTGSANEQVRATKGAPQVIMDLCNLPADKLDKAQKIVEDFASRGYRTLGVAKSEGEGSWSFLGIIPLFDPPRDDSVETIRLAKEHGLAVKMVTGDDTAIAAEISGQLNLGTHIRPANEIFENVDPDNIPDDVAETIEKADGFARVFPEHKYGIVKALQRRGHLVAMTGDGVNDAPALKQADAGIAVSGATDAARAAAGLVLTAPGLSVIIKAIDAARQIFERMMSYTIYRIAMTMDVMFFVVLAIILFPKVPGVTGSFVPLTPVMIILLALLDDIPIMTIAYDNTRISPTPVRWDMPRILSISTVLGIFSVIQTLGLYVYFMENLGATFWGVAIDPAHVQTMMFLQLVVGGHLLLFVTRQEKAFFSSPGPAGTLFCALIGTQIIAALLCGFGSTWLMIPALPWALIGLVWLYNLVWMVVLDVIKLITYRTLAHRGMRAATMSKMSEGLDSYDGLHNQK